MMRNFDSFSYQKNFTNNKYMGSSLVKDEIEKVNISKEITINLPNKNFKEFPYSGKIYLINKTII
jgi:hypothetical protein